MVYSCTLFISSLSKWPLTHFHDTVNTFLLWLNVMLKSGSLIEMEAHLCSSFQIALCPIWLGECLLALWSRQSTTRTSAFTDWTCLTPYLILSYPWHFRVLLSAVSTPTAYCLQKWHTTLLTGIYKHPESIRAVHSHLSTNTGGGGIFLVFTYLGRRLVLTSFLTLR